MRAESWDPPPPSGLIAVTVSLLEGDPWPDPPALRDAAAQVIRAELLRDVTGQTGFGMTSGRFEVAGADLSGGLRLGQAAPVPAEARVLVIRTGSGALIVTAFGLARAGQPAFAGLFGPGGMLMAQGPGSEALNAPGPRPPGAPRQAPPPADPGLEALLRDMQGSFQEGE